MSLIDYETPNDSYQLNDKINKIFFSLMITNGKLLFNDLICI
jgi:hypothetical protein